jgi:hypothetical protein
MRLCADVACNVASWQSLNVSKLEDSSEVIAISVHSADVSPRPLRFKTLCLPCLTKILKRGDRRECAEKPGKSKLRHPRQALTCKNPLCRCTLLSLTF